MSAIAVGQLCGTTDVAANTGRIGELVERAAGLGASLVVLPEYASYTPPSLDDGVVEHAEALDGPFATAVRDLAARHSISIVVGMVERIDGSERVHNTLLMVDAAGSLVSTYRKVHLFDALGVTESRWIRAGDPAQTAVFDVGELTVGVQTCYDLRFPESTRVLADAGAHVVAVPAQWVPGPRKEDQWSTLLRARAIENALYVAGAGQGAPAGSGSSVVVDPMGVVVAGLGDRAGVCVAEVDLERVEAVRSANPVLSARRYRVEPGRR